MYVRLKLIDIFRDFLPPGSDVSNFTIEVPKKAMIHDIFSILGIPDDLPRVILCNGLTAQEDQQLSDGDVIAIFSPIFGG
jgi:sulfur carrier protein ThiS